jgi:hypothetical protein
VNNILCNLAFYLVDTSKMTRILFLLLFFPLALFGQSTNHRFKSELGFMFGGSYYIGDLNQFNHFKNTKMAGGLVYRYNVHSRLSLRGNFTYGTVEASDADSKRDLYVNRNLSFQSEIFELAGGLEFNYFPFQLGHDRYKGTAYILTEIGFFRMNPMAEWNGELVELQPLGTEGQGSALSSKKNYRLTQFTIPLGVGFKLSLGKKASLTAEYGIRKTFTDYLDDVGSNMYVDQVALEAANGPLAAALSNRSLDASPFGKRGTESTSDWYSFFGLMITFRMGKAGVCNQP